MFFLASTLLTLVSAADLSQQGVAFPYVNQQQWQTDMLNMHNYYRSLHGVGAVTWNPDLATAAESNAAQFSWAHTVNDPYGENIATGSYIDPDTYGSLWYQEQSLYNYNNPGFSDATGHFTQLVWASTTQIGCAMYDHGAGKNSAGYQYSMTCEYYPRGNIVNPGYFAANVKPLVTSGANTVKVSMGMVAALALSYLL